MMNTKQANSRVTKKSAAKTSTQKIEAEVNEAIEEVSEQVSQQASSMVETLNDRVANVQDLAKQLWFASLGFYGRSFDQAQSRFKTASEELQNRYSKAAEDNQKLVKELLVRGEQVQDEAEALLQESRANIEAQIEAARTRLIGLLPVVDVQSRLQGLADKLDSLSKDLKKAV